MQIKIYLYSTSAVDSVESRADYAHQLVCISGNSLGFFNRPLNQGFRRIVLNRRKPCLPADASLPPIQLLSGVTLPLTLMPLWIRQVAAFNPLTYAVDAARSLFNGALSDPNVLRGFGVLIGLALLALWWAARQFRQATA